MQSSPTSDAPIPKRVRIRLPGAAHSFWQLIPSQSLQVSHLLQSTLSKLTSTSSLDPNLFDLYLDGDPLLKEENISIIRDGDHLEIRQKALQPVLQTICINPCIHKQVRQTKQQYENDTEEETSDSSTTNEVPPVPTKRRILSTTAKRRRNWRNRQRQRIKRRKVQHTINEEGTTVPQNENESAEEHRDQEKDLRKISPIEDSDVRTLEAHQQNLDGNTIIDDINQPALPQNDNDGNDLHEKNNQTDSLNVFRKDSVEREIEKNDDAQESQLENQNQQLCVPEITQNETPNTDVPSMLTKLPFSPTDLFLAEAKARAIAALQVALPIEDDISLGRPTNEQDQNRENEEQQNQSPSRNNISIEGDLNPERATNEQDQNCENEEQQNQSPSRNNISIEGDLNLERATNEQDQNCENEEQQNQSPSRNNISIEGDLNLERATNEQDQNCENEEQQNQSPSRNNISIEGDLNLERTTNEQDQNCENEEQQNQSPSRNKSSMNDTDAGVKHDKSVTKRRRSEGKVVPSTMASALRVLREHVKADIRNIYEKSQDDTDAATASKQTENGNFQLSNLNDKSESNQHSLTNHVHPIEFPDSEADQDVQMEDNDDLHAEGYVTSRNKYYVQEEQYNESFFVGFGTRLPIQATPSQAELSAGDKDLESGKNESTKDRESDENLDIVFQNSCDAEKAKIIQENDENGLNTITENEIADIITHHTPEVPVTNDENHAVRTSVEVDKVVEINTPGRSDLDTDVDINAKSDATPNTTQLPPPITDDVMIEKRINDDEEYHPSKQDFQQNEDPKLASLESLELAPPLQDTVTEKRNSPTNSADMNEKSNIKSRQHSEKSTPNLVVLSSLSTENHTSSSQQEEDTAEQHEDIPLIHDNDNISKEKLKSENDAVSPVNEDEITGQAMEENIKENDTQTSPESGDCPQISEADRDYTSTDFRTCLLTTLAETTKVLHHFYGS